MSRPSSKFLAYPSSFEMHPCNHSNGEPALYFCFTLPVKEKMALLSEMRVLVLLQKARLLASHLVIGDANVNAMVF